MMKKIKTALITIFVIILNTNLSFAQQGEILVTATKIKNNIMINYELLNEGGVTGIQFDIYLPKTQLKSLNISLCKSSYGKSDFAQCGLKDQRLRVVVINPSLDEMHSGEIGRVMLSNVNGVLDQELKVNNVLLFDNEGNKKKIKAVVDYKNVSIDLNNADEMGK